MIKIIYGKSSLHCQVAAALLLGYSLTEITELIVAGDRPIANKLVLVGKNQEGEIYYLAVKKDYQIIPEIIRSLEEMYGLSATETKLLKVSSPGLYLDILMNLLANTNMKHWAGGLYFNVVNRFVKSLKIKQASN